MMKEYINVVKSGVVIRQWPGDLYSLNVVGNHILIQDKESRKISCIISPMVFDYIEIEREEVDNV